MAHRKLMHVEKVKVCKCLIKGVCEIGDQLCWFWHTDAAFGPQTLTVFKCNLSEKSFDNKREFMVHRKNEHTASVRVCRDSKNVCCQFCSEKCWFVHENEEGKDVVQNPDMMQRLLNMIEVFCVGQM